MSDLDVGILLELGKFTKQLRTDVAKIPKEGVMISQIIDFIEKSIFKRGYLPAFPCTVSINEIAAHYTIYDEDSSLKKGDLVKIDFGIAHQGYITDNAFTIEIGTNKYEDLMRANKEALDRALEVIEVGTSLNYLGDEVYKIAKKNKFDTIHNLSGHQIGRNDLHFGLSVPNYDNSDLRKIPKNSEFAIEPFFTMGEPKVKSAGPSNILHLVKSGSIRDPIAKKILLFIKENFEHLPFSKRWLLKHNIEKLGINTKASGFDIIKINYGIKLLKASGIIYEYDCLASTDGAFISQFEDTVYFDNDKKIILTR